jgi:hypothetical protein
MIKKRKNVKGVVNMSLGFAFLTLTLQNFIFLPDSNKKSLLYVDILLLLVEV